MAHLEGVHMKKIVVAIVATATMFGIAATVGGCAGMGKGKAPPVVTKG